MLQDVLSHVKDVVSGLLSVSGESQQGVFIPSSCGQNNSSADCTWTCGGVTVDLPSLQENGSQEMAKGSECMDDSTCAKIAEGHYAMFVTSQREEQGEFASRRSSRLVNAIGRVCVVLCHVTDTLLQCLLYMVTLRAATFSHPCTHAHIQLWCIIIWDLGFPCM